MNKIDVCPQQILSFNAPHLLTKEVLDLVVKEKWQRNDNNEYSLDTFLHKRDEYKYLIKWFDVCLSQVRMEKRFMFRGDFKITQCWANKTTTGGSHHVHHHPNSILSGIFYLNDSTPTRFITELKWDVPLIQSMNNASSTSTVPSECGKLLIFPSTLVHGTDRMINDDTRYSMSFNTFISGELGDETSLDYVGINV
tara:strand:+ start:37 stop:624 length:588 start_codon:yes stop_codon:yes gene_type:complete